MTLAGCTAEESDAPAVEPSEASTSATSPPSAPSTEPRPDGSGAGAPTLRDPYVGSFGNGGYDAVRYDLTLRWQPGSELLTGTSQMTARSTQRLARFNLDLVGLRVQRVTVDGSTGVVVAAEDRP